MLEKEFQAKLIKELKEIYPRALIFKWDSRQGYPDVLILLGDRWAALECKRSYDAPHRPNQDHYVKIMNQMAFSAFICPENKEEVLSKLNDYFYIRKYSI